MTAKPDQQNLPDREQAHNEMLQEALKRPGVREIKEVFESWKKPEINFLRDEAVKVEPYFISGFLTGIDLEKKEVQIKLKTGRHLVASYSEVDNAESILIHNLGQPIFLYGDVGFNKDDHPVLIRNVNKILAVDESSIEMSEVKINNAIFHTDTPLKFDVTFDTEAFYYDLEGDFGIYIFKETREELEVSLERELQYLWNEFGEEQTDPLSRGAIRLQSELRNRLALDESNS